MTAEQSDDLKLSAEALQKILTILETLRSDEDVNNGDAAVEWVIEQLQGEQ